MTTITEGRRTARRFTLADILARISAYRGSRRVLRDLAAMEDHLLDDIGLTRRDVDRAAFAELGADRMAMLGHARRRRLS